MAKSKKEKATKEKAEVVEFKFGVADVAKAMGVQDTSARVALRKAGVKKNGRVYGWNSQKDLDAVVKSLKKAPTEKKEKKKTKK